MGIHTGEADRIGGRFRGLAVHRAARIGAAAHGGQVLVSESTKALSDDSELDYSFRDVGVHRLKDFDRPVRLFQLELAGLRSTFPPPRTGTEPSVRTPQRRGALGVVVAALAVATVAAVTAVLLTRDDAKTLSALAPNSIGGIDPDHNALVDSVSVGVRPTGVATGEGSVWVVNAGDSTVSRVDPESRTVAKTASVPSVQASLAAGEGGVWASAAPRAGTLLAGSAAVAWNALRLDPAYLVEVARALVAPTGLLTKPASVAVGLGSVWAAAGDRLVMIDPDTNRVRDAVAINGSVALAVGHGAVWNLVPGGASASFGGAAVSAPLQRIDPATRAVTASIPVAGDAIAIAAGADTIWVGTQTGRLISVDPETGVVAATIDAGKSVSGVAADGEGVWVANGGETTVRRIDPGTNEVVATIDLGQRPDQIAVGEGGCLGLGVLTACRYTRRPLMAVPKRKTSKSRRDKRRAQHALEAPRVNTCPTCGQPKRPHRVCPTCKTYRGREIEPLRTPAA